MNPRDLPTHIERPKDAADIFPVWPGSGVPPGSEDWTWHEQAVTAPPEMGGGRMVRNVVIPTLTMFAPAASARNGTAVIVAPGGAFHFLMMNHEGDDVARWLVSLGVTAFVLRYRLNRTPGSDAEMPAFLERLFSALPHPARTDVNPPVADVPTERARRLAEDDGQQAVRVVRRRAGEWGINQSRIGFIGFSAGGGIAISAALEGDAESRPDFVGGIYAGYRLVTSVPQTLPPLFLAIADDDALVPAMSSTRLYETWHTAGAPVELHVFGDGGHGFGSNTMGLRSDSWRDLFRGWLAGRGYLPPSF